MKLTCTTYAGFKEVVTQLGAATEIFYRGDASSTTTSYIVAYYSASPFNVVVLETSGTVLITTVLADYASANLIPGLFNVEV